MTISGFTMVRNATRFYFPIKESIQSILPIVDEFVVALGRGYPGDKTEEDILSINSPKIKIIHRIWDENKFKNGSIFREETNVALSYCKGDWCFYLQADEVIHEDDFKIINDACRRFLDKKEIEGMLFQYNHFWGDYDHCLRYHGICNKEIRIIRNHTGIQSYNDANSFRKNKQKLNVVELPARIFHYGWARPPETMQQKKQEQDALHHERNYSENKLNDSSLRFDYGPLGTFPVFKETHPAVMRDMILKMNWKNQLNYSKKQSVKRKKYKHEKLKYRIISWFENNIFNGQQIFGWTNWKISEKY